LYLNVNKSNGPGKNKSLVEALENLFADETLDGDNKYFCEACNSKQDAVKGMRIVELPAYVSFYVNRFDFDYNTFERIKVKSDFSYPLEVNLGQYLDADSKVTDPLYELFAVMVHRGTAYAGHYHIVIKDILNEVS
jgi:ubiquitin C-terminal hydrolase